MKKKTAMIKSALRILANIRREHTGAFAAQTAFFIIVSFIPMVFLVLIVVEFYGAGTHLIFDILRIDAASDNIFAGYYNSNRPDCGTAIIGLSSIILAAWSAGKSFKALSEGLHSVLHISDSRNYILSRIRGLIYSILFAIVTGTLFLFGIFSEFVYSLLLGRDSYSECDTLRLFGFNEVFVFVFLLVILTLIYRFVPDWGEYSKFGRKKFGFRSIFAGSFVSTFLISIYTVVFSYYISEWSSLPDIYGNLSTLVSVMLWLYGSMHIIILGFRLSNYINLKYN